jgi:glucosamine 6-phosphate synthetase-like amidotransferase/phosphosugar isomerase protein
VSENPTASCSAAMLGDEVYLLGSDITKFLRLLAEQMRLSASDYVEMHEREAALALAEVAMTLEMEADQMDCSLMDIVLAHPEDASDSQPA